MDIGHFYSPPADLHAPRPQRQTDDKRKPKGRATAKVKANSGGSDACKAMVDNKGWRKKIGARPKDLPLDKPESHDAAAALPTEVPNAIDTTDRRRHGWRKTITVSRPSTPITPTPPMPAQDEFEDNRSERSTPRRESKPKLIRYTTMFTATKEEAPDSIFSEPWSLDRPPMQEDPWSYVDPIVTMESIHSHMCKNYMVPVPLEYTSGLFQIFDDYRKLRLHKEHSEAREHDAVDRSRKVTAQCHQSEILYEAEIRRLELLIARSPAGIAGLMNARHGTVVNRNRQHRKTISTDRVLLRYDHMSPLELEEKIKSKTQQVLSHRPLSPSGKMTALSRQFKDAGMPNTSVETLHPSRESGLSRKVKSELSLTNMRHTGSSHVEPILSSTTRNIANKATSKTDQLVQDSLECDALIALRELGVLVARRKGLEASRFVNDLMALLTAADPLTSVQNEWEIDLTLGDRSKVPADNLTPRPPSRQLRSWSHTEHYQSRRRHFSFEPGDDHLRELETDLESYDALSKTGSTDSGFSSFSAPRLFDDGLETDDDDTTHLLASAAGEMPKPTMIPSPVQTMGRVRRENSMSSLKSVFNKNTQDDRRSSRTSIQTAFREMAGTNASIKSKSRSSSTQNLRTAQSPSGSKERVDNLAHRQSSLALAAARAAEAQSGRPSSNDTRLSTSTSSSRRIHATGHQRTENDDPTPHSNAGKKDAE